MHKVSQQLNSLAQTQAIVAQVEREIEQRTARARVGGQLHLLTAPSHGRSFAAHTTRRFVHSLFPAGL
ncbi:MAG TPA: hypothetical protein VMD97_12710 [Candidatus Aquilonibacter sp.]|nr:hypothetical protein [Candidatus Aquilonibacter sp.]